MLHAISPPQSPASCNRVWHPQSTVDISRLLKPKDEEEPQQTASPKSVALTDSGRFSGPPTSSPRTSTSQGRPLTRGNSTIVPAKRSARSHDLPTSESPAKKQSKWSPDEDAKIIQLRGEGMKWEDISKHLPGRSAISCRLHYQNYLERRSEWDEDRKNKLARLYERFKADMWAKIAEEMAIPWRAAEAMHWQMGEQEMARRAGVTPFTLTNSNLPSGSLATRPNIRLDPAPHMRCDTGSLPGGLPQLPSLSELTAGLPAYAPSTSNHPYGDRHHGIQSQNTAPHLHQTLTPPPGTHPNTEYFQRRP